MPEIQDNYYPPFRVASSVSDDIIERSLFNLCRYSDVAGKIEDNGEFKTIHLSTEESLDVLEDSLWPILDRLERDGSLLIFKDTPGLERHEDGSEKSGWWHVDGLTTSADETYEKHYAYTLSYLDNNVKGTRVSAWDLDLDTDDEDIESDDNESDEDIESDDETDVAQHSEQILQVLEEIATEAAEANVTPEVVETQEANATEVKPKQCWLIRLFSR